MKRSSTRLTVTPLETRRLLLEPLRVDHAEEAVDVFTDRRLHAYLGIWPETLDQLRARFARQVLGHSADGTEDWLNWMARERESGRIAGTVQSTIYRAGEHHDGVHLVAEVAWVVGREFQRRGLAVEAATEMTGWLRRSGVDGVIAHVHPDNVASIGVARSLGLQPTEIVVDGELRWSSLPQ